MANTEPLAATNYLIKHYPHRHSLTALGLGDMSGFAALHPRIPVHSYDGEHFPFPDRAFDIAHCNAVIEHVGSRDAQQHFLSELCRVARCGMVTTPNKYFPIETHTLLPLLHWTDAHKFRQRLHRIGITRLEQLYSQLGLTFPVSEIADLRLLSASELLQLAKQAGITHAKVRTHALLGWPFAVTLVWHTTYI